MNPTTNLPENYRPVGTLDLSTNRRAALWISVAGIVLFFFFGWLFLRILIAMRPAQIGETLSINIAGISGLVGSVLAVLGINAVMIVLHEAVHGILFWLFTRSRPRFAFKIWYAYASAPDWFLPRNIYLVVALAPLLVLTVLGLALFVVVPPSWFLAVLALLTLNASGAVGDLAVAGWLLAQPTTCLANDKGDAVTLYVPGPAPYSG